MVSSSNLNKTYHSLGLEAHQAHHPVVFLLLLLGRRLRLLRGVRASDPVGVHVSRGPQQARPRHPQPFPLLRGSLSPLRRRPPRSRRRRRTRTRGPERARRRRFVVGKDRAFGFRDHEGRRERVVREGVSGEEEEEERRRRRRRWRWDLRDEGHEERHHRKEESRRLHESRERYSHQSCSSFRRSPPIFLSDQIQALFDPGLCKWRPSFLSLVPAGYLQILLTDFGLAKEIDEPSRSNSMCGTTEYMAPEILLSKGHNKDADWWSVGVLLYEMLSGQPPFTHTNRKKLQEKIIKEKIKLPSYLTTEAHFLLKALLQKEPSKRLVSGPNGGDEIKAHKWFRTINWKKLEAREIDPKFRPDVSGKDCIANFHKCWTVLPADDSPAPTPTSGEHFQGYTYVASTLGFHLPNLDSRVSKKK